MTLGLAPSGSVCAEEWSFRFGPHAFGKVIAAAHSDA